MSRILSPVPRGSGATIIHQSLADHIPGYQVCAYNPYWTLFPPALPFVASDRTAAVIHCPPDYACFLAERKVPLVLTFHNYVLDQWMRQYSGSLQRLHYRTDLKWWTKRSVNRAAKITAVSHFVADLVRRELNPDKDISVIYNGVDTERFRPNSVLPRKSSAHIRVLFSGNLTARKGVQWLPQIADLLDKGIVIYYTAGLRTGNRLPARPNLISVGSIPFKDMPERYRDMDILLTPTVREGFGLAVAEAMASQLPVVASNCSAIPELVDDGRGGCLCPVGDVKAFAEKLNFLAASPGLRIEMGAYNREKAELRFSLRRMIGEYVRLFDSIGDGEA